MKIYPVKVFVTNGLVHCEICKQCESHTSTEDTGNIRYLYYKTKKEAEKIKAVLENIRFDVARSRESHGYGLVKISMNGEYAITFMDVIEQVGSCEKYYSKCIHGFASKKPDSYFILESISPEEYVTPSYSNSIYQIFRIKDVDRLRWFEILARNDVNDKTTEQSCRVWSYKNSDGNKITINTEKEEIAIDTNGKGLSFSECIEILKKHSCDMNNIRKLECN